MDGAVLNELSKLGTDLDLDRWNRPQGITLISDPLLGSLYLDPICRRVCSSIPKQMARGGVSVTVDIPPNDERSTEVGEAITAITKVIRSSKLLTYLTRASIHSSIYNHGCGVVLDVDDGQEHNMPVDFAKIKSVSCLYEMGGQQLRPIYSPIGAITGFNFFLPDPQLAASVLPPEVKKATETVRKEHLDYIHPSRVLWIEGDWTPRELIQLHQGSIGKLQSFWPHYARYSAALQASSNVLHKSDVLNVAVKGLYSKKESMNAEGLNAFRRMGEAFNRMLTNLGIVFSDMDSMKVDTIKRSTAGYPQLITEFKRAMIAASGLTEYDLFGLTTVGGGLSGVDLRDRMAKAEAVADQQEQEWREPIEQFLALILAAKDGPTKGKPLEGWRVEFPSTLSLSPLEQSQLRSTQANTDSIYANLGLDPYSILMSRFSGPYTTETTLYNEIPNTPPADPNAAPEQDPYAEQDPAAEQYQ